MANPVVRWFNAIGGSLMARSGRVGILGTTGAKTGLPRRAALGFAARADGSIVVGSGRPENHGWTVNLKADPACTFAIKGRCRSYRARLVNERERAAAIGELAATIGNVAERMTWGDLFVLEPQGATLAD